MVARHYAESLEAYRLTEAPEAGLVVDVGSGGGFPGIVIATVSPSSEIHLVEAREKRAGFLTEIAEELKLDNVTIHAKRAEEVGRTLLRDKANLVIARAVASLPVLLEYLAPLAAPGGAIAAVKGSRGAEELAQAETAMSALSCEHTDTKVMRSKITKRMSVMLFRKTGSTPTRFPRRPGIPAKRPITVR
tara:strand:- start:790 stop:1359 length:570 start_codon:yes stop_codon:yes gene_type:complete